MLPFTHAQWDALLPAVVTMANTVMLLNPITCKPKAAMRAAYLVGKQPASFSLWHHTELVLRWRSTEVSLPNNPLSLYTWTSQLFCHFCCQHSLPKSTIAETWWMSHWTNTKWSLFHCDCWVCIATNLLLCASLGSQIQTVHMSKFLLWASLCSHEIYSEFWLLFVMG